jgi:hypothetical protein
LARLKWFCEIVECVEKSESPTRRIEVWARQVCSRVHQRHPPAPVLHTFLSPVSPRPVLGLTLLLEQALGKLTLIGTQLHRGVKNRLDGHKFVKWAHKTIVFKIPLSRAARSSSSQPRTGVVICDSGKRRSRQCEVLLYFSDFATSQAVTGPLEAAMVFGWTKLSQILTEPVTLARFPAA